MGSGGRKASLEAILLGHGGQQNRQHSSLKDRWFILKSLIGREKAFKKRGGGTTKLSSSGGLSPLMNKDGDNSKGSHQTISQLFLYNYVQLATASQQTRHKEIPQEMIDASELELMSRKAHANCSFSHKI